MMHGTTYIKIGAYVPAYTVVHRRRS